MTIAQFIEYNRFSDREISRLEKYLSHCEPNGVGAGFGLENGWGYKDLRVAIGVAKSSRHFLRLLERLCYNILNDNYSDVIDVEGKECLRNSRRLRKLLETLQQPKSVASILSI